MKSHHSSRLSCAGVGIHAYGIYGGSKGPSSLSVVLSYCQIIVLSNCRIVELSYCRIVELSYCRIVVLSNYRIVGGDNTIIPLAPLSHHRNQLTMYTSVDTPICGLG